MASASEPVRNDAATTASPGDGWFSGPANPIDGDRIARKGLAVVRFVVKRRRGAPFLVVLVALLLVLPWFGAMPATGSTRAASRPPNIVFILTDDLDAVEWKQFPQIKKLLVDQGVSFDQYFATDSLCCPSRSSIFLGELVHNHHVEGNAPPEGGWQKYVQQGHENDDLATWLHSGGYTTGIMGKYLNGYGSGGSANQTHIPPGWDEWDVPINDLSYTEYNYTLNENGKLVKYGHTAKDYLVDVISGMGDTFITKAAVGSKPFFLEMAVQVPHQPATPAPRYANAFPGVTAPRGPAFNEKDVSDKPGYIQKRPLLGPTEITRIDDLYRKRLQSMLAVDDLVANVVKTLTATGQLGNTEIVFSSDNGFHLGEHRLPPGKQTAYETDIRLPLVIRGPGVPAGQTRDQLTSNIDLAPTFLAWAGVMTPKTVDGRSLVPLLAAKPPAWGRQAVLVEHYTSATTDLNDPDADLATINTTDVTPTAVPTAAPKGKKAASAKASPNPLVVNIPAYAAIRTADYTYVEYVTGEKELYDLKTDPNELNNLIKTADPTLLKQLSSYLATYKQCAGSTCRVADKAPVPPLKTT
jgi:arylsulfatase A-like enzyme